MAVANKGWRTKTRREKLARLRQHYTAAVRYRDGSSELFRVKNADDIQDARKIVMDTLVNVHSLLIAQRRDEPEE